MGSGDQLAVAALRRCAELAGEFAARASLPLSIDERLSEIHFGAWEGRTAADLEVIEPEAWASFLRDPEHCLPPNAEPFADFRARVTAVWDEVIAGTTHQRVLLVTHGGVIRIVLAQLLGCSMAQLPGYKIEHGGLYRFAVDPHGEVQPCFEIATG